MPSIIKVDQIQSDTGNVAATGNVTVTGNITGSMSISSSNISSSGSLTVGGDLRFNSGYGSAVTAYGCRAWVNFDGTGTVAIRASGNVTSITDNGTGTYTVNFTNAMPDANYAWVMNGRADAGIGFYTFSNGDVAAPSTTSFLFVTLGTANSSTADQPYITATFFR